MKAVGFILSVVVMMFSFQPLMSDLVHEKIAQEMIVQEGSTDMACCEEQSDCCCNPAKDSEDTRRCDPDQGCSEKCQCVTHSQTLNAISGISPQLEVFGIHIETHEILISPYRLVLPVSIWHPPQS